MSRLSNLRQSKIYPNLDFWFENKPSGNPDTYVYVEVYVLLRPGANLFEFTFTTPAL
jgi:hypothetical protein